MDLTTMKWPEVEEYLKMKKSCVIPIGSTEQHGPGGVFGTDHVIPHAIALKACETTKTIVTPCVSFGMSNHHLGFAGTISLLPSTLALVVSVLLKKSWIK